MDKQYDAIIVPGGGILEDGSVNQWSQARLDKSIELCQKARFIILSSGATPHKPPPLDSEGFPIYESDAMADYLMAKGVEPRRLLRVTTSRDTIGEAFMARVLHTEPRGLRRLLVITSEFHMQRVREVFGWVFGLEPLALDYDMDYTEAPDKGMDREILAARKEKESKRLEELKEAKNRIRTVKQFHEWLFSEHRAYATGLKPRREDGEVLQTY